LENPVRRSRFLAHRIGLTLAIGAMLIAGQIVVAQRQIAEHYGSWNVFEPNTVSGDIYK
jgi:hypothetical protein